MPVASVTREIRDSSVDGQSRLGVGLLDHGNLPLFENLPSGSPGGYRVRVLPYIGARSLPVQCRCDFVLGHALRRSNGRGLRYQRGPTSRRRTAVDAPGTCRRARTTRLVRVAPRRSGTASCAPATPCWRSPCTYLNLPWFPAGSGPRFFRARSGVALCRAAWPWQPPRHRGAVFPAVGAAAGTQSSVDRQWVVVGA